MSKEVNRYTFVCDIEDDEYVTASDYDALLAERDAVAALLDKCRTHLKPAHDAFMRASKYEEGRHKPGHDLYMQIDAALQGEQP